MLRHRFFCAHNPPSTPKAQPKQRKTGRSEASALLCEAEHPGLLIKRCRAAQPIGPIGPIPQPPDSANS